MRKSAMLNSLFLKKVVDKINSEKPGAIEIVEEKNDLVAYGTTEQQGKSDNGKIDSKTVSNGVVETKSTNGAD